MKLKIFVVILAFFQCYCGNRIKDTAELPTPVVIEMDTTIGVGASRMKVYLPQLAGKKVGMVVNQTSTVGDRHLIDTLLSRGVNILRVFAPEHGFRGEADAGATIVDSKDQATGLPVISLYGKKKKPSASDLDDLDLILFDIQDVGARFYTYISSLHYVMEACAENGVRLMVLDRPNPNGHYVDGPILDLEYRSFVGMHPVPVVHGMTIGEYAQMINGEQWLENGIQSDLTVIACDHYDHQKEYNLPIRPSPNLPNMRSIYLYPSLCFFEGTAISVGRGTQNQFQLFGHPDFPAGDFSFTPTPLPGARYPKHEGHLCHGVSLLELTPAQIKGEGALNLNYLLAAYRQFPDKSRFFLANRFIDKLAGSDALRKQIESGQSANEIRQSWAADLAAFRQVRAKYLLYP